MYYLMYLRKSRADLDAEARGEGETLARHRIALVGLAARNGHNIKKEYPEVVSGETIADRPQIQQLLIDITAPDCAGVYVMEVERLARGDTMDQGRVSQAFLYSNTRIITPAKTYDPTNEFDQEYFEFGLFMARREYKTINRRIQAGRLQSVREGKYICSRPAYGYRKVKIQRDKGFTLEVIPSEAQIVRQVFSWYVKGGLGLARIAKRLQEMGIDAGQQGSGWSPCRIHRMLTNDVYIGMIRWGRVKTQKQLSATGVSKTLYTSSEYELHKGLHPAIVGRPLFDAAQTQLKSRKVPMRSDMQQSNPLSGLLRCKLCGRYMRGLTAAGRQPARCYCATKGCPTVRNYRAPIEEAILDVLRDWLKGYKVELAPPAPPCATNQSLLHTALDKQQMERAALSGQISALHDLLERGVYTADLFAARLQSIQLRIASVNDAIAAIQQQFIDDLPQAAPSPQLQSAWDLYQSSTPAMQCRMLKALFSVVDYSKATRGAPGVNANQFTLDVYPRFLMH